MADAEDIVAAIRARCRDIAAATPEFRKAAVQDLHWLETAGAPRSIIQFYSEQEPVRDIESEGVYLIPIARIRDLNERAVPGVALARCGWLVVASTVSGDAYAVRTGAGTGDEEMEIRLFAHDRGQDADQATLLEHSRSVCHSFFGFLSLFAAGRLPYDVWQA